MASGSDDASARRPAKAELRQTLRALRAALGSQARRAGSERATAHLLGLPELGAVRTLALHVATSTEADPGAAFPALRVRGVRLAFPRVVGSELDFVLVDDMGKMTPGYRGVLEPSGESIPIGEIEAVILPGIGFDRRGWRLGQGGGHYDRTLVRLRARTVRIGFCFDCQLMERMPMDADDQPVDIIVTEREIIRPAPGPRGSRWQG